jgi:hypothetical protein
LSAWPYAGSSGERVSAGRHRGVTSQAAGDIVVPALHLLDDRGAVDTATTSRYAHRAAATWIPKWIVSGSTAAGNRLSSAQRASLLDLWLDVVPAGRLLACCWNERDITEAGQRSIAPMVVMRAIPDPLTALSWLQGLPCGATIYSHPLFTAAVLDSALVGGAAALGVLPAGAKVAKIDRAEVARIRQAGGPGFALWDGSCRHIAASIAAGASGVVATPLASLPRPFPPPAVKQIQRAVGRLLTRLDDLPDRPQRAAFLRAAAVNGPVP